MFWLCYSVMYTKYISISFIIFKKGNKALSTFQFRNICLVIIYFLFWNIYFQKALISWASSRSPCSFFRFRVDFFHKHLTPFCSKYLEIFLMRVLIVTTIIFFDRIKKYLVTFMYFKSTIYLLTSFNIFYDVQFSNGLYFIQKVVISCPSSWSPFLLF